MYQPVHLLVGDTLAVFTRTYTIICTVLNVFVRVSLDTVGGVDYAIFVVSMSTNVTLGVGVFVSFVSTGETGSIVPTILHTNYFLVVVLGRGCVT